MNGLGSGDVLVVAGKGHEQGQTIGDTVIPFDDVSVVRRLAGTP
jgi:UDP-N-acetylmuramoyl-L-alanyl-D-glutamate--2,6-diaminopimelate ligase